MPAPVSYAIEKRLGASPPTYCTSVGSSRRTARIVACVACLVVRPAAAQTGSGDPAAVVVECASIGESSRAAIEARIRAELAWSPLPGARIRVDCRAGAAIVMLQTTSAPPRQETIALSDDPAAVADSVLGAVHALRLQSEATSAAPPSAAPPTAAPPTAAPPAGGLSPSLGIDAGKSPSTELQSRWFRVGATAGAGVERWQGAIGGAAGPRLGLRFWTTGGWSSELAASAAWGWPSASGVRGTLVRGAWTVAYAPAPPIDIVLGGEVLDLIADSSSGQSHELAGVTAGGIIGLRIGGRWDAFAIAIGPQLEVLALPLAVQVAGRDVFSVQRFVVGAVVEMEADFLR
jgi:hypothetical protein